MDPSNTLFAGLTEPHDHFFYGREIENSDVLLAKIDISTSRCGHGQLVCLCIFASKNLLMDYAFKVAC